MLEQIKKQAREKMSRAISVLKQDLLTLRTGRANPAMLDKVTANYYGNETPIKQMANITIPDPRTIVITPWDKSCLGDIEQAIVKSELGLTPNSDGTLIRINIPMLTEDRRGEMVKMGKKIGEEAKVSIRNVRRDANDDIKKLEKKGEIPEDQSRRAQDEIQKLTDQFTKEADQVLAAKEKEILEV